MDVVLQVLGLIDFETFEVRVQYKLLSGNHLICSCWNDSTVLFDEMNQHAQPIQFCEIFGLHDVFERFEDDFFMLTCEVVVHLAYSIHKIKSWLW